MSTEQLNYWICWDETNINEPCFLCDGDPHEVLYEMTEFQSSEGKSIQIPIPKRDYDEFSIAKLFNYSELGNGLLEAHVKYLLDGLHFDDPDFDPMCGVITRDGTIVIPFSYTEIHFDKKKSLYRCYRSKRWKPTTYWEGRDDHIAHSRTESGELIIEHDNNQTIVSKYYDDYQLFSEGLCAVRMCSPNKPNGNGWGFVNSDGIDIIPHKSEYIKVSDFQDGFAVVKKLEKSDIIGLGPRYVYNYISSDGIELLDTDVVKAYPFNDGFATVKVYGEPSLLTINKLGMALVSIEGSDKWISLSEIKALHNKWR